MSFQAYLDNAEKQTGITPRAFLDLAAAKNLTKPGEIIAWLKEEHTLGHGHATAIARLITKGPEFIAEHHTGGAALHLDGLAARP
ncbi:hypothetical protein AMES_3431 [Amycolatopsis mediterranei S699]|uniref:DUF4287 domain-containing protein n=3 Tax=Amycolatopsis mediterranei TaxID=33910 RepID=A0A0H3D3N9_AMYMU|nr:DUF4287 domain-containing protein [Amycolatopsis mediterranei]ADJ45256.1 conserved hypothetical protein [Amycolatopsis mediterranei U32]AEK42016.1 hypothetical protein RAM_17650 [Amycolatopsis mediterranei S699]AFO76967.1 hypothetical protein AMES_3431 [Amycolatopsis mediterranei S699]AGT84095.1 hypothetical protein B737_3431 [Amycolatopsis mediterranei RB]KDO08541.1 hypothetical protein DV26_22725 [Amycolatopsis mediterranei]